MKKTIQENIQATNGKLEKEQEEIRNKNKKEDKKALLPFVLMVSASTVVGALFGFFSAKTKDIDAEIVLNAVRGVLVVSSPYVIALCILITIYFGFVSFFRCRREYRQGVLTLSEDELADLQDKIEYRLNRPLVIASVVTLIGFFEMSVILICMEKGNLFRMVVTIAEFVLSMVLSVVLNQKIVNFEKEMNPEKQGSVFSVDFQKTWVNSCDEAEKSTIYEAAYFSYTVSNTVSVFLWVILTFAGYALGLGILPSAVVVLLWGIQVCSYCYKVIKTEKERYLSVEMQRQG